MFLARPIAYQRDCRAESQHRNGRTHAIYYFSPGLGDEIRAREFNSVLNSARKDESAESVLTGRHFNVADFLTRIPSPESSTSRVFD